MSKDGKTKDKSKRRESKSGSSSSPKKSRKSSSITVIDDASSSTTTTAPLTPSTAFETLYPILNLPIPPVFTSDPYSAFSDLLDTLVMRYVPQLSGVLITHSPTRFLQDTAVFSADSAFATANVGFECVVWRPKIGSILEGNIALSSPSHVSLLLYGLFNASIPASHLPSEWQFVDEESEQGMGYWKSSKDGSKLGGEGRKLSFTVISLTVANHMLSLHGSLLDDPFKGPPPTLDRSYLKKTAQTLGLLGSAASAPTTKIAQAETQPESSPTPTRRVRWQDETDSASASDSDDPANFETPPSIVQAQASSKRKPTTETEETPSKREKKRRKEA